MEPEELVSRSKRAADKYSTKLYYTDYDDVYSAMLLVSTRCYNKFLEEPEKFSSKNKKKSYLNQGYYRTFLNLLKFQKRNKFKNKDFLSIEYSYPEYK